MNIVQADEQPLVESQTVRSGTLGRRYLFTGDEESLGNFICMLAYQSGDFYAPRHHHNFDQWRYQIEGEVGFGTSGVMKPGTLGYFPEGAYYGPNSHEPESADAPNVVAVIQCGGPSGQGFPSADKLYGAHERLKAYGRFEKGVFYRNEGIPGKKTMDSFQASWEFLNGRPLVYPKPQYDAAIMMDTHNYRWMPFDGAPGVEEKAYGTFTDCKIRSASYKLDPGASLTATGRGIYFVLNGKGTLEGGPMRKHTSLYLASGESATFTASETTEILLLGLPDISRMRTPIPELETADDEEAAEVSA
jgi:hypothetical protein